MDFNGTRIEVTWAKPVRERTRSSVTSLPSTSSNKSNSSAIKARRFSEVTLPSHSNNKLQKLALSPPKSGCFLNHRAVGIERSGPLSPACTFQPLLSAPPYSSSRVFTFPPPSNAFQGQAANPAPLPNFSFPPYPLVASHPPPPIVDHNVMKHLNKFI